MMWGLSVRKAGLAPGIALTATALLLSGGQALARTKPDAEGQSNAASLSGGQARRATISPYIEVDQTVIANVKGGDTYGDFLTYTSVAAGVDAAVAGRRAEGQISLRYEHQFGWNSNTPDQDIISGIARGSVAIIPDTLRLDAAALATRARADGLYGANNSLISAGKSTNNLYSFNIGPTLTTHVGDLIVNAAYRFGYTKMDATTHYEGTENSFGYNNFDDSINHSLTASVGMDPGALPFGWTISGGYDFEKSSVLDQKYSDKWVRGDVTFPVTPTIALVGGLGYEKIRISQDAVLADSETGQPILDDDGRYQGDPDQPRMIAYDNDAVMWDVGVLWRPSRRTSLELRAGRRYDSMHYVGNLSWQPGMNSMVRISYFDTIDSFGRGMSDALFALPLSFSPSYTMGGDISTCMMGGDSASGVTCLNDTLAGINASNYRRRGVSAQYSEQNGRLNWGVELGWNQRKFLAPNSGILAQVNGRRDNYYYGVLFGGVQLDPMSSLTGNVYVNYMDAGINNVNVTNIGAYTTYARQFGRRLSAQASAGVDSVNSDSIDQIISLLARIGVRYQF